MRSVLFTELLGGIGDLIIALGAIQAVARSHPHARMTVLTFAPGSELLAGDPHVHEVLVAPGDRARASVEELLARRAFDLIVTTTTYEGIGELAERHARMRAVTNLWRKPPADELVAERFVRILTEEGVVLPDAAQPAQLHLTVHERQLAGRRLAHLPSPLVALIPDTGMRIKRWPHERFVELGQELTKRGCSVLVPVAEDEQACLDLAAHIGPGAHRLPRGPLRDLAAVLSHMQLVVAVDTGPARIAAALGVPTVTLFGPAWHGRYGQPYPHVNLQGDVGCPERNPADFTTQPCWYSGACPQRWATSCLEGIQVHEVLDRSMELLGIPEGGAPCVSR